MAIASVALYACTSALKPIQARAATSTSLSMHASFLPDRLGANTALTLAMGFAGLPGETPAPVRSIVLHLPAGLGIALRSSSSCAPLQLRRHSAAGCPRTSLIGRGHAQLEVHAGSQTIPEQAILWVFRGPARSGSPTIAILGIGSTPLHERTIDVGVLRGDSPPYGAALTLAIPAIPTLVYEPDASFDSLTVTIGGRSGGPSAHSAGAIRVPRRCRTAGFPFAAYATFADGSTAHATTSIPCP